MAFATTTNFSTKNATSLVSCATYTAAHDGLFGCSFNLTGLNAAAATITVVLRRKSTGGTMIKEFYYSEAKRVTTDTAFGGQFMPVFAANTDVLELLVLSSNGSDTSIGGNLVTLDVQYGIIDVDLSTRQASTDVAILPSTTSMTLTTPVTTGTNVVALPATTSMTLTSPVTLGTNTALISVGTNTGQLQINGGVVSSNPGTYVVTLPATTSMTLTSPVTLGTNTALISVGTNTGQLQIANGVVAASGNWSTLTDAQVWTYGTRTLTESVVSASDVWTYATRTLTQTVSTFDPNTDLVTLNTNTSLLLSQIGTNTSTVQSDYMRRTDTVVLPSTTSMTLETPVLVTNGTGAGMILLTDGLVTATGGGGGGLTQQQVRDSMLLTPSTIPSADSIDAKLNTLALTSPDYKPDVDMTGAIKIQGTSMTAADVWSYVTRSLNSDVSTGTNTVTLAPGQTISLGTNTVILDTTQPNYAPAKASDIPTASQIATTTDTLLSTNHGTGTWTGGGGGGTSTTSIEIKENNITIDGDAIVTDTQLDLEIT